MEASQSVFIRQDSATFHHFNLVVGLVLAYPPRTWNRDSSLESHIPNSASHKSDRGSYFDDIHFSQIPTLIEPHLHVTVVSYHRVSHFYSL